MEVVGKYRTMGSPEVSKNKEGITTDHVNNTSVNKMLVDILVAFRLHFSMLDMASPHCVI